MLYVLPVHNAMYRGFLRNFVWFLCVSLQMVSSGTNERWTGQDEEVGADCEL